MKKHIFWGKLPKYNLQQPKEVTMDCFYHQLLLELQTLESFWSGRSNKDEKYFVVQWLWFNWKNVCGNDYLQVYGATTGRRRQVNLQFRQQLLVLGDPVAKHVRVVRWDDCHL